MRGESEFKNVVGMVHGESIPAAAPRPMPPAFSKSGGGPHALHRAAGADCKSALRGGECLMSSLKPPTLREWLASEGGAVPFRRFMEAALYDPAFGYYTRQIRTVGARGDFSTSATLSPRLARAIAAWVAEEAAGGGRHLIEIGPGSGVLHRALRQALGWRGRWHWHSHLVERSPVLRAEQQRALGWTGRRVAWHDSPSAALAAAGGEALIFSNEVVDAFPVTLFERQDGIWQEVWLELLPEGRLVETLHAAPGPGPALRAADFPDGQRVETHESWQDWLASWVPRWRRGAMLTIDYGDTADRLYHRRPQGTLRGYHRHRRLEGLEIYRSPGECDLTADVNFSDLMQAGTRLGLTQTRLMTQGEFLAAYSHGESAADSYLADEQGPGGAFRCLIQQLPH